jgi:predicted ATP-dependent endonuclease of OLD family
MPRYIKHIEAQGVLGRFDIDQEFQEGVNVLFGRNGTGKTTLLHILANLLNGDYKRFFFIEFERIQVQLDDGTKIVIFKDKSKEDDLINVIIDGVPIIENISIKDIDDLDQFGDSDRSRKTVDLVNRHFIPIKKSYIPKYNRKETMQKRYQKNINFIIAVAYFPAFRTMIEAWASSGEDPQINFRETPSFSTNFARELFGAFVPSLNYPSLIEIESGLSREIEEALLKIARADRENFGELVPRIFQVLSKNSHSSENVSSLEEESKDILEEINSLIKKLEDYPLKAAPTITQLRAAVESFQVDKESKRIAERVLEIYREALKKVIAVQEDSFKGIEQYFNSVNSFLEGKSIEISLSQKPSIGIKFEEGNPKTIPGIRQALSSGEREIVTLIYAATHMSKQQIVLIDEPEISLHVDWQRNLLQKMSEQLGDRQIIVCTHSPVIGADYEERVIIFEPKITCSSKTAIDNGLVDEDNEVF